MGTNNSIRLRTRPGSSRNINVKIQQEFDTIDFLSLKITQEEAYRNFCSDYGVIAGRVIANDGYGVGNAKISIFIPLSDEDAEDPIISSLYPYVTPIDTDSDGIRYNLLPALGKTFNITIKTPNNGIIPVNPSDYFAGTTANFTALGTFPPTNTEGLTNDWILVENEGDSSIWRRTVTRSNAPEVPVGTFPEKFDILDNDSLLEIYDKYYKYTTRTNPSGDYMLFGVPLGTKTVHMDVDLSDIGGDSLIADDFINDGIPLSQFDLIDGKYRFKSNTNLDVLPQIEAQNLSVDVIPFWGNPEQCEIGITRQDFVLTKEIKPSALLIFEAFANNNTDEYVKTNCGAPGAGTNDNIGAISRCSNLGVGVEACRANINQNTDFLPTREFPDGKVIYTIPMYSNRVITDEFGNLIPGDDVNNIGIPTAGKYNIFVYSLSDQVFFDSNGIGFGTHLIREVNYQYDVENSKKLIYTCGVASQLNDINGSNKKTNAIVVPGNTRLRYPSTWKIGNDIVFSAIDGFPNPTNYPVVHGSLFFRRFEFDDGEYCSFTARDGTNYFYGNPPTASNMLYEGSIINNSGPRNPTYGALHITNLLKLFKPFGGPLRETSADNFLFNGQATNPGSSEVEISNQTYPITSSAGVNSNGEVNNIPVGLDMVVDPSSPDYGSFNTKIVRVLDASGAGNLGSLMTDQEMGEKSKEGRYFFYFGLIENNTVLTKLKSFLGV